MTEFKLKGKEMLVKTVKKHGGGAMIYVPKAWIDERVAVIKGVEE